MIAEKSHTLASRLAELRTHPPHKIPWLVASRLVTKLMRTARGWWFRASSSVADPLKLTVVRGQRIALGVRSETELYRLRTYSTKEPDTLDWIDVHFKPGDVLFDIGANIGVYSLYAASVNRAGTVYSFEPEAQNFARLCRNVAVNGFSNVVPTCTALADNSRFDYFFVGSLEAGSALHSLGTPSVFRRELPKLRQGALCVSLDDLLDRSSLPRPSLMKIDVDGIEAAILRGAEKTLRCGCVRTLLVELNATELELDEICDQLSSWGYTLSSMSEWSCEVAGLRSRNYVFTRREERSPDSEEAFA